ncbi:MAG: hypothetical protein HPY57_15265 [Ignavibacteria bacterium]|nr:hypothetical protein [Ignavibacteria bacterium]
MKKGYVTFVNNNQKYIQLTNILIESLITFSKYNIEVFAINFNYKYNSDRVISRRINVNNENFASICYSKLYSSLNSEFDIGVQLDADMILTKYSDNLFEKYKYVVDSQTPFGSLHPSDPNNQIRIMNELNVKQKTQPYVHATYIFSKKCKNFFKDCYDLSQYLFKNNINPPNYDETIYNVMLWKYNSTKYADCYDPYYEYFINPTQIEKDRHGYGWMNNVDFYICHGVKDITIAKNILQKMK